MAEIINFPQTATQLESFEAKKASIEKLERHDTLRAIEALHDHVKHHPNCNGVIFALSHLDEPTPTIGAGGVFRNDPMEARNAAIYLDLRMRALVRDRQNIKTPKDSAATTPQSETRKPPVSRA